MRLVPGWLFSKGWQAGNGSDRSYADFTRILDQWGLDNRPRLMVVGGEVRNGSHMAWMCPSSVMSPDTYPYHPSPSRTSGLGWQRAGPSDSLWSWVPCSPGSALPSIQVSADKKQTGSTVGMQTSVETSTLLKVGLLGTGETRAPPPTWVCRGKSRM